MSLSTEIQRTNAAFSSLSSALSATKAKIISKGGNIGQNAGFADVPDALDTIPSGGGGSGSIPKYGVLFLDYDGSIVEAWDSASVASKTTLPENPTRTGLVAQGWNRSLENIKNHIARYPNTNAYVGQMYKTVSGLTEFDITVTEVTGLAVTCNMSGRKNWGDGTTDNQRSHTYTDNGDYTITCDGTSIPTGTLSSSGVFGSSSSNTNRYWCTAARVGSAVTSIGDFAFGNCYSLTSIIIPENVTSIGDSAFRACYSLTNVIIPEDVTSIGSSVFNGCYSLTNIMIPENVTSISSSAFNSCYSVTNYDFSTVIAVPTLSNTNAFTGMNGICKIFVPAALYDDWIAATNWATYADYIFSV